MYNGEALNYVSTFLDLSTKNLILFFSLHIPDVGVLPFTAGPTTFTYDNVTPTTYPTCQPIKPPNDLARLSKVNVGKSPGRAEILSSMKNEEGMWR